MVNLYMYAVICVNIGSSKDPFLTQTSEFALLLGNELDAEVCCRPSCCSLLITCYMLKFILSTHMKQVLSMSMDLFIARMMITKASLVFRGSVEISKRQVD